ncbi:MAG: adenylosuccinate synthase [Thermoanaerobaculia bacterium]
MEQKHNNLAVIGAQWGDEGKGKIVDLLCEGFDVVARYQGGHNAGHTVRFGEKHYSLHLIPSGILHPEKTCVLGNGMVIDPEALLTEMKRLEEGGVVFGDRLWISESAHCILPFHKALDIAREESAGSGKIGTTGRGIGPAYETKINRSGIVMGDLLDRKSLTAKVTAALREKNALLTGLYGGSAFDAGQVVEGCMQFGEILRDRITNVTVLLNEQMKAGKKVMFEGAQGTLLDVDHGTYPYVTSSTTTVGGVCSGLGVAPSLVGRVAAVAKAYTTRVGSGPFPTELLDETGDRIRTRGNEFGTTTGRPRRIGWLDLVVLHTAKILNGIDEIALTKLDVLDDLAEIPVCVAYRCGPKETNFFPRFDVDRGVARPVYRTMKGWQKSTVGVRSFDELPPEARDYVRFVEDELQTRVSIISTGPRREETIIRG